MGAALFDARVNLLIESVAFNEAVAISSVSNNDFDAVMRWSHSKRAAFIEVYKRQNPRSGSDNRPSQGPAIIPGAMQTISVPDDD